jgi:hypothetical protein
VLRNAGRRASCAAPAQPYRSYRVFYRAKPGSLSLAVTRCHCSQRSITTSAAGARYPGANFWDLSNNSLRHLSVTGNQGTQLFDFTLTNILFTFLPGGVVG